MTLSLALALLLLALVGLSLGLLGGGGSILAVPVLVYVAHLAPADAIAMSLLVVGASSVVGGVAHHRAGTVDWRTTGWFAAPGIVMAYVGAGLTRRVPGALLLLAFAVLMVGVGVWMLVRARAGGAEAEPAPRGAKSRVPAILAGAVVGAITGFLGVGGGFLIVPALVAFTGLGMRQAVGTSLVIIAINSGAAFVGHLGEAAIDWPLAAAFTVVSVVFVLIGARLGRIIPPQKLRIAFAILVLVVGVAMGLRSLTGP